MITKWILAEEIKPGMELDLSQEFEGNDVNVFSVCVVHFAVMYILKDYSIMKITVESLTGMVSHGKIRELWIPKSKPVKQLTM